ncbi:proline-rich protein 18 [Leptodactylus fuscus]|uniref:proline-rich protein 18 n=1 Tax=Leptodactylus fuscus TaxID=238119 RepID=UPI003F4EA9E3
MALPPIPQHPPGLSPHRAQLGKLGERRAPTQPALGDLRKTSMDKKDLSNSWPSASVKKPQAGLGQHGDSIHPARRFLEQVPRGMTRSYESVIHPRQTAPNRTKREPPHPGRRPPPKQQHTAQHEPPAQQPSSPPKSQQPQDAPFTLRLTPEAILVIQKRSLEKQHSQQRSANARRIFATSSGRCPRSPLQRSPPDVRELVKISLLNDQHRYDDMEYEDECCWLRDGDEGLVRKCTEWLHGVEMATGRGGNLHDKLQSLPHLNTF